MRHCWLQIDNVDFAFSKILVINLFQIPHSFPFDGGREWDVRETMRHPQHIQQSSHYTWLVDNDAFSFIYLRHVIFWRHLLFCYDLGTDNLLVESNVVYDVMGGAIFIEDGIETGNIIQYNMVVFVRQSTSLLNDDITPGEVYCVIVTETYFTESASSGTAMLLRIWRWFHLWGWNVVANIVLNLLILGLTFLNHFET